MSFFKIARDAGAAEYGRARAERYGRAAKAAGIFGFILGSVLVIGIIVAIQGGFGG